VALGAGRARLVCQLVTEGALLAIFGGALGVALAQLSIPSLAALVSLPYLPVALETAPDQRVVFVALAATMLAALLAGAPISPSSVSVVLHVALALLRTVHAARLSWADRIGGSFLGVAEGELVAGILLVLGTETLGRDHDAFRDTRSLVMLEEFERVTAESGLEIDVASPPRIF